MKREQAKEYIKSAMPEYLRRIGIDETKPFCCLNPAHQDKNPSMSYDKKRGKVHCFSCGADYDTFDLIGIMEKLETPADIFLKAYDIFNLHIDETRREVLPESRHEPAADQGNRQDFTAYYKQCAARIGETDYLQQRGISAETAKRFLIGYEPEFSYGTGGNTWQAVIIPTGKGSYTARNTDPNADKKNRIRKQGENALFNTKGAMQSGKPVFIVEGEIDALSVEEVGGAAIGLGSTSNTGLLLRFLEGFQKELPTLIIALDNDDAGRQAAAELEEALKAAKIPAYTVNPYGAYKDANEALQADRSKFQSAIEEAEQIEETVKAERLQQYMQAYNAGQRLQGFINGIADSVNTPGISTGFAELDRVLDGGLYEGLYICGAVSSLGKTSFILQVADQIAEQGQDVLIFSLEMAAAELMAKSISRETVLACLKGNLPTGNAKTARGITDGKRWQNYSDTEFNIIQNALSSYETRAKSLYIVEGVGNMKAQDIRTATETHISITGRCPVVIVDYLQILAPYSERMTDKQSTDNATTELKRISRDYKIPVLCISSLNRNNYKEKINMAAFKESGAIEYSSDIVIGLQLKGSGEKDFDVDFAKTENPRRIELHILKNRSAATGGKVDFLYYPMFNYFRECGELL